MNRATTPLLSNHESTAFAIKDQCKILYKPMPFVICKDFCTKWTVFATLCGLETASKIAWKSFQKDMFGEHKDKDAFENALYQALAKALGEECCHLDSDKNMIIFNNQKSWRFARQAHQKKNVDSGSSVNFACDDHDSWHDHGCVLF